jgi:hypothetical protein
MSKLVSATFRLRSSENSTSTLEFTGFDGRKAEIAFPTAALQKLANTLADAATKLGSPTLQKQLDQSADWRTTLSTKKEWNTLTKFQPGPHGGVEIGTSVDLKRVWLCMHADDGSRYELLAPPETFRTIQKGISVSIQAVEGGSVQH